MLSRHALMLSFAASLLAYAAGVDDEPARDEPWRLGGPATVLDDGIHAFSYPTPTLDAKERRAFAVGNAFFKDNWITAPASAAGRDGLGPLFNARSCSSCHLRDGRAAPPGAGDLAGGVGSVEPGLLLRVGVRALRGEGPDAPHPRYGGQLQDRAIQGLAPEARVRITTELVSGTYADGERWELVRPTYALDEPAYGELGEDATLGPRIAPQIVGLGLLEAIPDEDLVARADPDDADGDGVSGRAHWVVSRRSGRRALGRFGWKATQPTVEEQVAAAFVNDIGITSSLFPDEALSASQEDTLRFASGGAPELDDHKLARVTFYSSVLAVPAQRDAQAPEVRRGRELFEQVGCGACHVERWTTGDDAEHEPFRRAVVRPYTDLLLHDMGAGLADGKRDGQATGREWRTPPLWGVGLFEAVNGHTRYLHDGRARDLGEAILWHGGEAAAARERFVELDASDRRALLAFLRSL